MTKVTRLTIAIVALATGMSSFTWAQAVSNLDVAPLSRDTARSFQAFHSPASDWMDAIPDLLATEEPHARREALRSWIEFRHRTEASSLSTAQLKELFSILPAVNQRALVMLNLHWLRNDPEAQQELSAWIPLDTYSEQDEYLQSIGLVPASVNYWPDVQDIEEQFDFWSEDLKPLARSGLKVFLEGRATPRQLAYYMGMQNSAHGQLGKKIGAWALKADPTLRSLEVSCGFQTENLPVQPKIMFLKYVWGQLYETTFRNWFKLAHNPELTDCLVEQMGPDNR